MSDTAVIIGGHNVKLIVSCVRRTELVTGDDTVFIPENPKPRPGDLVMARVVEDSGFYEQVEDSFGRLIPLSPGDMIVAVLGDRKSGTNIVGDVPVGRLRVGDRLDLVALGGLLAICRSIPPMFPQSALGLEVVGFPADPTRRVKNIDDLPVIDLDTVPAGSPADTRLLFVLGTSAEVGKTTFVTNVNVAAKQAFPGLRTGAIKACGTGRMRDLLAYRDAGYDVCLDFVACGIPSTYGMSTARFRAALRCLAIEAGQSADLVVVEVGGDLLEACAPEAVEYLRTWDAASALIVNDAMGAIEGVRRIAAVGAAPTVFATYRQNLCALAERLEVDANMVISTTDVTAMTRVVKQIMAAKPTDFAQVG